MHRCQSAYVFSPRYLRYDLGPDHPLRPQRLAALCELLDATHLFDGEAVRHIEPAAATDDELRLAHDEAYIAAVRALSEGRPAPNPASIGLGPGDTPAFPGMHGVAAMVVGGTLAAMRAVMGGETAHAFNPGGGWHHGQRDRAAGFCVYNDLVVAAAAAVIEHGARVLYIDLDVHHGDGVQAAFYDDPRVLTVSVHETGRYLFPGTGAVLELGAGAGLGYSVNAPLAPFTEDASWLSTLRDLLPALAQSFQPDLILSQHGCDGHVWDGQSHFLLTMRAFDEAARLVHELAHRHCEGRWVATGGGGYDPIRVVPRAWTALWAAMTDRPLPRRIPATWRRRWGPQADGPVPEKLADPPGIVEEPPRRAVIEAENRATVLRARELALSPALRLAYRPSGPWTPGVVATFPPGRTERLLVDGRPLILRERTPPTLLRRLHVAADLHAFARSAAREGEILRQIAARPDASLTVAQTPAGEVVAQVTLAPAEGRWLEIDAVYEIAIEVAGSWRGSGLAGAMLRFVLAAPYIEDLILVALGLSWHWDLAGLGVSPAGYREILIRTFAPAGFQVFGTDDAEILAGEGNVLLARVGARVPADAVSRFHSRLYSRLDWFGI